MNEHPILFSGPMVRAILAGKKTQTRRVMKPQPHAGRYGASHPVHPNGIIGRCPGAIGGGDYHAWKNACLTDDGVYVALRQCPYGEVGTRLWVREAFLPCRNMFPSCPIHEATYVCYRDGAQKFKASGEVIGWGDVLPPPKWDDPSHKFRPSIHMPRWACRIVLEITEVRVERLHSISNRDCVAEGFEPLGPEHDYPILKNEFRDLWEKLNGKKHPWASNPWCWCISFRRAAEQAAPAATTPHP